MHPNLTSTFIFSEIAISSSDALGPVHPFTLMEERENAASHTENSLVGISSSFQESIPGDRLERAVCVLFRGLGQNGEI